MAPDKWAHALVYGVLAALIYRSTSHKWVALGLSTAYGIAMEVVQYAFFPGRYFEIWDALANFMGAIAAIYIMRKFFNS
jgi:VanZ family protein